MELYSGIELKYSSVFVCVQVRGTTVVSIVLCKLILNRLDYPTPERASVVNSAVRLSYQETSVVKVVYIEQYVVFAE